MDAAGIKKLIKVGDVVETVSDRRTSSVAGVVTKIGRVNLVIHSEVRFAPDGPWFKHDHTVSIGSLAVIVRDGEIFWKKN